jgi:hypothetical protein
MVDFNYQKMQHIQIPEYILTTFAVINTYQRNVHNQ